MILSDIAQRSQSAVASGATADGFTQKGKGNWSWANKAVKGDKYRWWGRDATEALQARREQDYQSTFAPIQNEIIKDSLKTYDEADTMAEAGRARRLYDVGIGALQRERRGMGLGDLTSGQKDSISLRRKLTEIDAGNRKIGSDTALRTAAQGEAASIYSDNLSMAGGIYSNVMQSEMNRKMQYDGARAQRNAGLLNMGMAVLGAAAAI